MELLAEFLAVCVGFIWATSGLLSVGPTQAYGALAFSRIRQNVVCLGLLAAILFAGMFEGVSWHQALILSISGFVGIFLGDTFLFMALRRLGPRRNAMIFATNAPMTALLAVWVGRDQIGGSEWTGIILVLLGVLIAILYGKPKGQLHTWEQVRGPLWVGVGFALLAALGQAGGLVVSDFVIDVPEGDEPPILLTALIRVGIAAVALNAMAFSGMQALQPANPITMRHRMLAIVSGLWGMGLGMSLLIWAQSLGSEVGLISALSQTTPIWILPLIWIWTRQRPASPAFIGAGLAVAGIALIYIT